MSKCSKVKNPCKICLGAVTPKNGLQCKGACKTWMHFECLNYTPGKIKDIKAGIIKVTCPCPDCKTIEPKEYRTDQPFSCTNVQCPANRPAKCDNKECPSNKPPPNKINQTSKVGVIPCPLQKCGNQCKQNSFPQIPSAPMPSMTKPCNNSVSVVSSEPVQSSVRTEPSRERSVSELPRPTARPDQMGLIKQARADLSSMGTLQQMCKTVGQLANQINHLMNKMKEVVADPDDPLQKDKDKKDPAKKSIKEVKEVREVKEVKDSGPPAKPNCPKPCHCPDNPNRKK